MTTILGVFTARIGDVIMTVQTAKMGHTHALNFDFLCQFLLDFKKGDGSGIARQMRFLRWFQIVLPRFCGRNTIFQILISFVGREKKSVLNIIYILPIHIDVNSS